MAKAKVKEQREGIWCGQCGGKLKDTSEVCSNCNEEIESVVEERQQQIVEFFAKHSVESGREKIEETLNMVKSGVEEVERLLRRYDEAKTAQDRISALESVPGRLDYITNNVRLDLIIKAAADLAKWEAIERFVVNGEEIG